MIDRIIGQRYKIIEAIGSGGAGQVFKGVHLKLNVNIAIKAISKETLQTKSIMGEVELLKQFRHPGLPLVYDVEEDQHHLFIIQELIVGETLQSRLLSKGRFQPSEAIALMEKLLPIVHYLHTQGPRPIIHRDIKPENIMLHGVEGLKLIDFGIAREFKVSESEDTFYLGTRGYAAPEQFGRGQSDVRTDIYALGMILYVLLTGDMALNHPLEKLALEHLNTPEKQLGLHLEKVIFKATQFIPDNRYETVMAFRNEMITGVLPETTLLNEIALHQTADVADLSSQVRQDYRKRTIIGIQGAKAGVGVTHLCLMMGFSLKKMGFKVTIVHEGSRTEYSSIYSYYEGDEEGKAPKALSYFMDGVEITELSSDKGMAHVLSGNRDFYIIDCGTKLKCHQEWIRAHVRIGIYSSALWQMAYNQSFAELYADFPHMTHLFSTSDGRLLDAVLKAFEWSPRKYMKIPFQGNPFKANEESVAFIEGLLDLRKRKKFKIPFVGGI